MPRHIRLPRQPMHAHAAPMDRLRAIAADPLSHPAMSARQIIEAAEGSPLGNLRTLKQRRPSVYAALRLLTAQRIKETRK